MRVSEWCEIAKLSICLERNLQVEVAAGLSVRCSECMSNIIDHCIDISLLLSQDLTEVQLATFDVDFESDS